MFTELLYELRAQGIPVGTGEWMGFLDAMQRGIATDVPSLYRLGRALLCRTEADYDAWDLAWREVFGDAQLPPDLVEKLEAWWIELVIGATLIASALPIGRKAWGLRGRGPTPLDATTTAGSDSATPSGNEAASPDASPPDARPRPILVVIEVLIGAALGALSGVVGLLLGTMRLPAMLRLGVSAPKAAGTNMAIGFFTGVAGALGAVGSGRVSWEALALVGGATFVGAWLGAKRTKSLPTARHFALIAGVLVVVGGWLIAKPLLAGAG